MPSQTSGTYPLERLVRLHDGREVSNYSEEWRNECEARHVLNMPFKRRKPYLEGKWDAGRQQWEKKGVRQVRGDAAANQLIATIKALWLDRQG